MFILQFQNGTDWFKANWIFRQFAEDIMAAFPEDTALRLLLEKAQAFGGLRLDSLEEEAVTSMLQAMRHVAENSIQGSIPGWKRTRPEDKDGQQMYLKSISELLDLLKKHDRTS
jgi:hypothetical protein